MGTNLGNGTWIVQTNDVSALMVTTPADYTGAVLLHAVETGSTPTVLPYRQSLATTSKPMHQARPSLHGRAAIL